MRDLAVLADGTRLAFSDEGDGPPLVLCHGGPGLWDYLQPLADLLTAECRVIRFDQRGCGRSTGQDGPYTIAQYVADLDQLRTLLGLESWWMGGHSWGAALALHYAVAHPDATRGVLYLSGTGVGAGYREPYQAERARRLGSNFERWRELSERDRTPDEEHEWCVLQWSVDYSPAVDGRAQAESDWASRDTRVEVNHACNRQLTLENIASADEVQARLPGLRPPLLVVHGQDDPRPVAVTDSMIREVSGAQRVLIPHAGHSPWVEQPEQTRQAVLQFVAGHAG